MYYRCMNPDFAASGDTRQVMLDRDSIWGAAGGLEQM